MRAPWCVLRRLLRKPPLGAGLLHRRRRRNFLQAEVLQTYWVQTSTLGCFLRSRTSRCWRPQPRHHRTAPHWQRLTSALASEAPAQRLQRPPAPWLRQQLRPLRRRSFPAPWRRGQQQRPPVPLPRRPRNPKPGPRTSRRSRGTLASSRAPWASRAMWARCGQRPRRRQPHSQSSSSDRSHDRGRARLRRRSMSRSTPCLLRRRSGGPLLPPIFS
mmetsp:Transcript_80199/g.179572  ORF Transcript_80199/g.179572 Transcript_80199/m.179572 type:complete len:215 (+) Transcript_80199:731-1375(+)